MHLGHRQMSSERSGQGASTVQCTGGYSAGAALLGLFPEVLIMVSASATGPEGLPLPPPLAAVAPPRSSPASSNGPQSLTSPPNLQTLQTMQYLEPKEAHRVLVGPVCRVFYQEACSSVVVWRSLCSSAPWHVPLSHLDDVCMCDAHVHLGHPRCNQSACASRALRRKHHMLLSQVDLIQRQSGSREVRHSPRCSFFESKPTCPPRPAA